MALLGIVAISFAAIFVRAAEVSPSTSAFFRGAYALPGLVLISWIWRTRDQRPLRDRWLAFTAGCLLGLDLTVWHHSIEMIGAGLSTVLANLQVVLVGLAAWALLGERPSNRALLAVPVALIGVALTTGLGQRGAYGSDPIPGAILATLAAVAYTGFLLVFRRANRTRGSTAGPLLDATLGLSATALLAGLATDPAFNLTPTWPGHGWLVLLGAGTHTVGWLAIAFALPRLPALSTSLLLLLQPVLTVLWGVLLFSEAPSLLQWLGVAVVLGALAASSLPSRRRPGDASPPPRDPAAPPGDAVGWGESEVVDT